MNAFGWRSEISSLIRPSSQGSFLIPQKNSGRNEKFKPVAAATLCIGLAKAFSELGAGSVSPAKCSPTAFPFAWLIHTEPESPPLESS